MLAVMKSCWHKLSPFHGSSMHSKVVTTYPFLDVKLFKRKNVPIPSVSYYVTTIYLLLNKW